MAILRLLLGLIVTIAIASFAVLNRLSVDFVWSPMHDSVALPIYVVTLGAMAFGFIFGGAVVWLNAGKLRREKRKQKKYIKTLEKELGRLKEDKFSLDSSSVDNVITLAVR